ncbi:MAG: NUDIX hydrolase [Cyanophyceae cyanobacterium]
MALFQQIWRYGKTFLGLVFRRPLVGTTAVPILADGSIVLARRRDDGLWSLPGGLVDWGETIADTLERELREETGLRLLEIKRLVGVYSARDRDPRMHSVCIAAAVSVAGTPQIQDTLEIGEIRAFPPDFPFGDLHLSHDHARQLQDYLAGRTALA